VWISIAVYRGERSKDTKRKDKKIKERKYQVRNDIMLKKIRK